MPMTVEKIDNKPVIIVTNTGQVTADERAAGIEKVLKIVDTTEGTLYRVIDVRDMDIDFPTFMVFLKGVTTKEKGSIGDDRFYNVFVGRQKMVMSVRDAIQKRSEDGNPIPMFWTMEDALTHVDDQINLQT